MTDLKRCAACRHWDQTTERSTLSDRSARWYVDPGQGVCLRMMKAPSPVFVACDDDSAYHEVVTPPDFGCVLWEAKP